MGKRKAEQPHADSSDEEIKPSSKKVRRKIVVVDDSSDEETNFKSQVSPEKNTKEKKQEKRSNKKKKPVENSDEEMTTKKKASAQKSDGSDKKKKSIYKKSQHPMTVFIDSDHESDKEENKPASPVAKGGKKQVSLEQAFALKKSKSSPSPSKKGAKGTAPVQKNTLDRYFCSPSSGSGEKKEAKKVVSVDDFFGKPSSSSKPSATHQVSQSSTSDKKTESVSTIVNEKQPVVTAHQPNPSIQSSQILVPETPSPTASKHKSQPSSAASPISSIHHKPSLSSAVNSTQLLPQSPHRLPMKLEDTSSPSTSSTAQSLKAEGRLSPLKNAWLHATSPDKKTPIAKAVSTPTHQQIKVSPEGIKENTTPNRKRTHSGGADDSSMNTSSRTPKTPNSAVKDPAKVASFLAYKQREGPKNLGAVEIPEGAPNCLVGMTFVFTGVMECAERDDIQRLVERCGGRITTGVSKKTSFLVIGREPGQSKISKAEQCNTKQIDEDAFYDLVRSKSASAPKPSPQSQAITPSAPSRSQSLAAASSPYFSSIPPAPPSQMSASSSDTKSALTARPTVLSSKGGTSQPQASPLVGKKQDLWVEKYRPKSMKQLVGQHGPQSCANKLLKWLGQWHEKLADGSKKKAYNAGFGRAPDDGAGVRAALLSGPPGVGKTTTAQVVCAELGFTFVELNASDTRNKNTLKEAVSEALKAHSVLDMFTIGGPSHSQLGKHHCLIMDEVDGMAGNEDRGGMAHLIQLIKETRIPIICLCNDRQSPKIRSLVNYCLDLRFQRPRAEQIKGAVMSIACKEGVQIPPGALTDVINSSNNDLRQIINNLEMWSVTQMSEKQLVKDAGDAQKDMKIGPFEVIRKVFLPDDKDTMDDRVGLFFQDYSLGPLFVQENYVSVQPRAAQGDVQKTLYLMSKASDAIAFGDIVNKQIRTSNNWSLLPTQAMFSSVLPGAFLRGSLSNQISFPSWLGKNSTQSKTSRQLHLLAHHMRLATQGSCDSTALATDYVQRLAHSLADPLRRGDSDSVLSTLDSYQLMKDDMDTLLEVATWPNSKDWMAGVDSKTKAALTRAYNKGGHHVPYSLPTVVKKGRGGGGGAPEGEADEGEGEEAGVDSEPEGKDDLDVDAMIVKKKPKKSGPTTSKASDSQPSTSKTSKPKTTGGGSKKKKT